MVASKPCGTHSRLKSGCRRILEARTLGECRKGRFYPGGIARCARREYLAYGRTGPRRLTGGVGPTGFLSLKTLVEAGVPVVSFNSHQGHLEDLFMALTEEGGEA